MSGAGQTGKGLRIVGTETGDAGNAHGENVKLSAPEPFEGRGQGLGRFGTPTAQYFRKPRQSTTSDQ